MKTEDYKQLFVLTYFKTWSIIHYSHFEQILIRKIYLGTKLTEIMKHLAVLKEKHLENTQTQHSDFKNNDRTPQFDNILKFYICLWNSGV
jgi:hypothetical protein